MNVICYKRVSTDEQANIGHSLQHQEAMLIKYCEINNHNIVGIYTEDYSGKSFDRPEWKKIMTYIKQNKGKVDLILCNKWDRFSRNHYDSMTVIRQLQKLGITVNTVEQPLDITNPDDKILFSIYLSMPEVENDKIGIRTTEGSRRARLEGCWMGQAIRGYNNFRDGKKSTLRPNKDAELITQAFEKMATGAYSAEQVRRWINERGIKITKQPFLTLLRNPGYMGKIKVKAYKDEPEQIVDGIHPALVSEETFYKVQDVLMGRKRNMKFHDDKSDLYPLKGFLKCPIHNKSLTAYGARSKTGKIHHYYLCGKDRCKHRYKIEDVHNTIEKLLSKVEYSAQIVNLYKKTLENIFEKEDYNRKHEIQTTTLELARLETRKTNLLNDYMDRVITPADYHEMKEIVNKELVLTKDKLIDLQQQTSPFKTYIKKELPMLENLVEYYRKSDGATKKKILGCIFSEKLVFENKKDATPFFTEPVQLIMSISKGLGRSQKKTGSQK